MWYNNQYHNDISLVRIEPIVHEIVPLSSNLESQAFVRKIQSRPSFFTQHVHTLYVNWQVDIDDLTRILAACSGIVNLCWRFSVPLVITQ
jgi:hypothetical protein